MPKRSKRQRSAPTCSRCGERGHKRNTCPQAASEAAAPKPSEAKAARDAPNPPLAGLKVQDPLVKVPNPSAIKTRAERPDLFWEEGKPLPTHYPKRIRLPCRRCKRVALDSGRQAVTCKATHMGTAYIECRACGYKDSLPIWQQRGGS